MLLKVLFGLLNLSRYKEELRIRASGGLSNTSVISDELLEKSINDVKDIIENREVSLTTFIDLAYFRLKLRLKIKTNSDDELVYKEALYNFKKSPNKAFNKAPFVQNRKETWK